MGEVLSKLFDIGKLPSKVVALVCLVSGIVLFSPATLNQRFHTKDLLDHYGLFIGLAFIASGALLAVNTSIWLYGLLIGAWRRAKWRRELAEAISRLDRAEIAVLREFVIQGKTTLMLPVDEPTVAGLLAKRMLHSVGSVGQRSIAGMLFPVTVASELWEKMTYDQLGLPPGEPTPADIERVRSERPVFMHEIARSEGRRGGFGSLFF
jgi:hypothetical protein